MVGRDDDDDSISAGSEVSDDAASWETVNDDEMDAVENTKEVCFCLNGKIIVTRLRIISLHCELDRNCLNFGA